jgi:hypothetical protein
MTWFEHRGGIGVLVLQTADDLLLDERFSSAKRLTDIVDAYTHLAIVALDGGEIAGLELPGASSMEDLSPTFLRSPVVRSAASRLVAFSWRTRTGERTGAAADEEADELAAAALSSCWHRAVIMTGGPLMEGRSLTLAATARRRLQVWLPDEEHNPAGVYLRQRFARTIGEDLRAEGYGDKVELTSPDMTQTQVIAEAIDLLGARAPDLTESLFNHVQLVGILSTSGAPGSDRLFSASNSALPGAVFLGGPALTNRLAAAEALMHEAAHQRLYELAWTLSIYADDYDESESPRVVPPWYAAESGGGLAWPADRVLAALHVYAHLALLWRQLLSDAGNLADAEVPIVRARMFRAITKGRVLLDFAGGQMRPSYGPDGWELVSKLGATLDGATIFYSHG